MMQQITNALQNSPTALSYYHAARYLEEQKMKPKQCLEWLLRAENLEGPKYYISMIRSLCYARLGDYRSAVNAAKQSRKMADFLDKDEFVRMNDENIKMWSLKLTGQ